MSTVTTTSVQEAAKAFALQMATLINQAAAEAAGVEVMWFRATPDKRSQDVIFQSYTLFGVEDCPLTFKAVYSDTGYDDAAITYNIMGLEYAVPLTLEIAVQTWYNVTSSDGTLPQRGDIVFIPMSNKLVEVVSMTPVKAIGMEITSFKVNCSIYKPTRSRLVGENLKTSIEENTVNLMSRFGEDISNTIKNVVDNNQLDMHNSTTMDKHKRLATLPTEDSVLTNQWIQNIISNDLIFDGHIVARTYYDMDIPKSPVVSYVKKDILDESSERCLSCWFSLKEFDGYKNIKKIHTDMTTPPAGVRREPVPTGQYIYIDEYSGKRLEAGTKIVFERGKIVICGEIDDDEQYRIKVHPNVIKGLNKTISNWQNLTGYIIRKDNPINLLVGKSSNSSFSIDINGNNYVTIRINGSDILVQLSSKLKGNKWYGAIINLGKSISVDIFEGDPAINKICGVSNIPNKNILEGEFEYSINPSNSYMTNIRLYDCSNNDLDKQITDLVSYNTPYNSHAIINDSADTPLNKQYRGEQR